MYISSVATCRLVMCFKSQSTLFNKSRRTDRNFGGAWTTPRRFILQFIWISCFHVLFGGTVRISWWSHDLRCLLEPAPPTLLSALFFRQKQQSRQFLENSRQYNGSGLIEFSGHWPKPWSFINTYRSYIFLFYLPWIFELCALFWICVLQL